MKDNGDKYNQLLGDKLRGFREEPPAGMFERIEQTLVEQGVVAKAEEMASEPAVVVPLWRRPMVRSLAAVVAAAVVALAVVVNMKEMAPQIIEVAQMPAIGGPEVGVEMPSVDRLAQLTSLAVRPAERVEIVEKEAQECCMPDGDSEKPEEVQSVANSDEKKSQTKAVRSRRRTVSRKDATELDSFWRGLLAEQTTTQRRESPSQIGLYAANVGFNRGNVQAENVAGSSMMVNERREPSAGGGSYMAPSLVAPLETSRLEHYMPVTVGVTVSYTLYDWLSMDSGLLYTNLYSSSVNAGAMSSFRRRRTMDYLGVPLALSASIVDVDRFSIYGRLGGTAELCINANDKTFIDGEMADKSYLDVPALTFSLDAAVGASFQLLGNMGLFGEVGCSYWMAPEEYPENYRTVHPLSLSSRFGVRFTFN